MIISISKYRSMLTAITAGVLLVGSATLYAACDTTVSATTPSSHFTYHRDGTVTDHTTGLMWSMCYYEQSGMKCDTGTAWIGDWEAALAQINLINDQYSTVQFGGTRDWRLPNIKELSSLLEAQCVSPSLNPDVFPIAVGDTGATWTSSPETNNGALTWVVDFTGNGIVVPVSRYITTPHIRLVRDADKPKVDLPFAGG